MTNKQYSNNILIVEDESIIALNIKETLTKIGYKNIDIVHNIKSANKLILTNFYDLAILDINLGNEFDGIDLATSLKEKYEHLPIVFLTGNSDNLTVLRAREVEPNAYLIKPFNQNDLRINLDLIFHQRTTISRYTRRTNQLEFSKTFLENHPNLILRLSPKGDILFVNPFIQRITGNTTNDYESKTIFNAGFEIPFVDLLTTTIANAELKKRKFTIEHSIPTILGERLMFIVVIPEFKTEKVMSSLVLIMQDITDQHIATLDLIVRNKKITDSINYSKKIQEAILPTSRKLQQYLPDSCILLKPKDVVSGDFPWVHKIDNYLYVAAVDCTGHGVPGALLSIIIHFLLNEIVKTNGALLPSKILEILHIYTRRTLKQNMIDVESNDGADIALCRIDINKEELLFSGAHRALYYSRNNEIIEVKGDKQPIGGEHYTRRRKRLRFTNNKISFEPGDKFLIFSDGLPDQFGGTQKSPSKLGITAVKDIFKQTIEKSNLDTVIELEKVFKEWKSDVKQTDDVLIIGFSPPLKDCFN
jgi:CheY-like chemotaxis protein